MNFTLGILSNTSLAYIMLSMGGFWYFQLRNWSHKREHMRLSRLLLAMMPMDWKEEAEESMPHGWRADCLSIQSLGDKSLLHHNTDLVWKKIYQGPKILFSSQLLEKISSRGAHYNRLDGAVWHMLRNLCLAGSFSHKDLVFFERCKIPKHGELH